MGSVAMSAAHGGHHDRTETQQAAFMDRIGGRFAVLALRVDGEVNHHDGVFLHDADEHDEADETVDVQIKAKNHQRQQRAKSGRRQAGQNRERMDETFVENSEDDVDDENGNNEQRQQARPATIEKPPPRLENLPVMVAGRCMSLSIFCNLFTAVPSETPGARLKEMVTDGNWPTCEMLVGPTVRVNFATALKGINLGTPLVPVAELVM